MENKKDNATDKNDILNGNDTAQEEVFWVDARELETTSDKLRRVSSETTDEQPEKVTSTVYQKAEKRNKSGVFSGKRPLIVYMLLSLLAGVLLTLMVGGIIVAAVLSKNDSPVEEPPTVLETIADTSAVDSESIQAVSYPNTPSEQSPSVVKIQNPNSEMRGIYIATVFNINYPSKNTLSAAELQAELDDIIATCLDVNLNAIYFQVRPSSDALYKSDLFPTSEYLVGKQGGELIFDPLEYLVRTAHEQGIAVHAWVNPMRITCGSATSPKTDTTALSSKNPAYQHPEWTVAYADGRLYYNVGIPEVRQLIANGVAEIVSGYDIDGVIFDDYFYPYPVAGATFNDADTYRQYGSQYGDKLSLEDWRRKNVDAMIEACYHAVKQERESCQFGVAPFGIWQNNDGENGGSDTSGMQSYSAIYCNPLAWIEGGYIDYIAPQIYWRFSTEVARYDVLVRWWNMICENTDVKLYISHGIYNYEEWTNPEDELRCQIEYARAENAYRGSILYGYAALKKNAYGLLDETREVYANEIIYTDTVSNGKELIISIPYSGSYIDGEGTFLIGTSDPTEPLYIDGNPVGRTKSGYFSVYLSLNKGKNTFKITHKGKTVDYVINRGTAPTSYATYYATLPSYQIAAVSPATSWFNTVTELSVSVTAPSNSKVTATLDGKTYTLSPTLYAPNTDTYMKEVYTGTIKLTVPSAGKITNLGKIHFKAVRGSESAEADSGIIRIGGSGAVLPVEITANDTELKISTNSWYYDDYSPQSAGMCDNAVSLVDGWYKLRCGGYVAAENIRELSGSAVRLATLTDAEITVDAKATYVKFKTDVNIPVNCYIENGEVVVTFYNMYTSGVPKITYVSNPIFTSVRSEKAGKAYAYKYFLKLVATENFYGFDYYYKDGCLVIELTNPTALPDSGTPLAGKTIILDAGHGGKNPGALGPLGDSEGAMNESDFNLAIVLAAAPKLETLGATVVLTRDEDCEIDVPINDRLATLIETDPDLCISIHQNSMPYTTDVTKVRGLVGLYWADSGYMLTDVMGETMAKALNRLDRSPTQQRLAMVRNPKFPATLVEVCFITNVEEYERMMQPNAIDEIAASIADGVLAYYDRQKQYLPSVSDEAKENIRLVKIVDLTAVNRIDTSDALEYFFNDGNHSYVFPSLKSEYVECYFSDGSKTNITDALKNGTVSVSDLDLYGISYWIEDKNGNIIDRQK